MTDVWVRVGMLAGAWLVGWWLCARVRTLPGAGSTDGADVSVVVPARDEARTLPTLLDGLARQRLAPIETIVVDDHSSDGTAAVAARHGAQVVVADALAAGWTGKAAAVRKGASAARGGLVAVIDADVDPGPELLERLVAAQRERGGLLSVQPYHRMVRWWERASGFFNLVAVMGTGLGSPAWPRRRPIVTAFGPVLVCERVTLVERIAHRSVRGAVLDDVALARRFAAEGESVRAFGGRDVVEFRMYDRPGSLVEGWTKNFASGAGTVPWARLVLIVLWVAACLATGLWLVDLSAAAIALYVAFAVQVFVQLRQLGSFGPLAALLFPVLALVFVVLFLASVALTVRGEVRWKQRRVALRTRADNTTT